jgi:hypothetical protein
MREMSIECGMVIKMITGTQVGGVGEPLNEPEREPTRTMRRILLRHAHGEKAQPPTVHVPVISRILGLPAPVFRGICSGGMPLRRESILA